MIRTLLAASAATAVLGSAALAGPLDVPPPASPMVVETTPIPRPAFSGGYVGLGFGSVRPDVTDFFDDGTDDIGSFENGRALGAFAGYNLQNGNLVYGPELRYLAFDDADVNDLDVGDTGEVNHAIDLRGRVGYAFGDAMVYGALGYSWVDLDVNGDSFNADGVSYGLGAEYNVTESIFVGVDVTRRDVSTSDDAFDFDGDVDTATLRVGYRF